MKAFFFFFAASTPLFAQSFVSNDMTAERRLEKMRPHFFPAPGDLVEINPSDFYNQKNKDPLTFMGFIEVKPPKGTCFTVMRKEESRDEIICTPKRLSFTTQHLDRAGILTWHISTGKGDFGTDYTWRTPHRFAQTILAGKKDTQIAPIAKCIPQTSESSRRVILEMMNGERWSINFPIKDKASGDFLETANLITSDEGKKKEVDAEGKEVKTKVPMDDYVQTKSTDSVMKHWTVPKDNSYTMSVENIKFIDNTPPGSKGKCRYRYEGAPGDPSSAWIECHEADMYDVVMITLSCLKKLGAQ